MLNGIQAVGQPSPVLYADAPQPRDRDVDPIEKAEPDAQLVAERVSQVYAYTAIAFAATCITAFVSAKIGFAASVLSAAISAPWMTAIFLTAVGISLLYMTKVTSPEDSTMKHGAFGAFAVFEGVAISPLVLVNSAAFAAASATTVGVVGGLGILAMTLKESFEKYEKILMVALGAIAAASIGACFFPGALGAFAHQVSYVGGFALFSALVIYDTHKVRSEAANEEAVFDPINHSVEIYLDAMNILVRLFEAYVKNQKK